MDTKIKASMRNIDKSWLTGAFRYSDELYRKIDEFYHRVSIWERENGLSWAGYISPWHKDELQELIQEVKKETGLKDYKSDEYLPNDHFEDLIHRRVTRSLEYTIPEEHRGELERLRTNASGLFKVSMLYNMAHLGGCWPIIRKYQKFDALEYKMSDEDAFPMVGKILATSPVVLRVFAYVYSKVKRNPALKKAMCNQLLFMNYTRRSRGGLLAMDTFFGFCMHLIPALGSRTMTDTCLYAFCKEIEDFHKVKNDDQSDGYHLLPSFRDNERFSSLTKWDERIGVQEPTENIVAFGMHIKNSPDLTTGYEVLSPNFSACGQEETLNDVPTDSETFVQDIRKKPAGFAKATTVKPKRIHPPSDIFDKLKQEVSKGFHKISNQINFGGWVLGQSDFYRDFHMDFKVPAF